MQVTKSYIENYIATHSEEQVAQFIGRALVVLFNNQTADEKRVNDTNQENGIGFTGADAQSGSISAKYFLKHRTMLDWQVERWTKRNARGTMRIAKYHRQLDAAAQLKANKVATVKVDVKSDIDWKNEYARVELCQERKAHMAKMGSLDFALRG